MLRRKSIILFCVLLFSFCIVACKDEVSEKELQKEVYFTVSFNTLGGTNIVNQSVLSGEKVIEPSVPVKPSDSMDYHFSCWLFNGERYDFGKSVYSDMILTAYYIEVPHGTINY